MQTYLHLSSGEVFSGLSFGYYGEADGEVVFSTGMTGYVQSLTDPSFAGQILTFTYPLIGNYGVPSPVLLDKKLLLNWESEKVQVRGVVVSEHCISPTYKSKSYTLASWLETQKIPGIYGIDTRHLTLLLREKGTIRGIISPKKKTSFLDISENIVSTVSINQKIFYKSNHQKSKHIVLIDCGVKHGIIRKLLNLGYSVSRIPWDSNPDEIKNIDGVVVSNGPGDPKNCSVTIENIKKLLKKDTPFLGICLGHQLLALAIGADTYKLPYGHRGINQPCMDIRTRKVFITSQNHGYACNPKTIPDTFYEWFINLNDKTNEGLKHKSKNISSVQFHPEGNPGPFDTDSIFKFIL